MRSLILALSLLAVSTAALSRTVSDPASKVGSAESPRLRRPVALVLADDDKRLLIANRDAGTIGILDTQTRRIPTELKVGRRLADMTASRVGDDILVVDEDAGELVLLKRTSDAQRQVRRLPVGLSPVSVQLSANARIATVACLWPRRLAIVDLAAKESKPAFVDLPFAPRRQLLLPGDKVIVADSFGGKLAVVDIRARKIESVRDLP